MTRAVPALRVSLLFCPFLMTLPCPAIPAAEAPPPDAHLNEPKATTNIVRVVAHGSMVLLPIEEAVISVSDNPTIRFSANTSAACRQENRRIVEKVA